MTVEVMRNNKHKLNSEQFIYYQQTTKKYMDDLRFKQLSHSNH